MSLFDEWSDAELARRQASIAYSKATSVLVEKIISVNGGWPCSEEDSEFVSVDSDDGPVMLELMPEDDPKHQIMPFRIHHVEKIEL